MSLQNRLVGTNGCGFSADFYQKTYLISSSSAVLRGNWKIHKFFVQCYIRSQLDDTYSISFASLLLLLQHSKHCSVSSKETKAILSHHTLVLVDLHWLPVEFRTQYKILLLVYKSLHGKDPAYLA